MRFKNIFSILVVMSFCLLLSGCKATQKDLNKEIEKMKEIVQNNEVFEEDYKISTSMIFEDDDGKENRWDITLKKDSKKIYMYTKINEGELIAYIGEKDGQYYVFYDNGKTKKYEKISKDEYDDLYKAMEEQSNDMKEIYTDVIEEVEENIEMCENEEATCSITKKLLKKEITFKTEKEDDGEPKIFEITLKNGKILKIFRKEMVLDELADVIVSIDYDDQKVTLPSTSDYEYHDGLADLF